MIKEVLVNDGQNLFDLAVQEHGSADAAIALAIHNNLTLDAAPEPGSTVEVDKADTLRQDIVNYLPEPVNTGILENQLGIGQMGIEFTFIVS